MLPSLTGITTFTGSRRRMNIEYKIDWQFGIADVPNSITVTTELELAKLLADLTKGKRQGYVKNVHIYQREVSDWGEVTFGKELFKPGDTVMFAGVKHTLLVLVFPAGVATWVAISEEVGAESTLIEEADLLVTKSPLTH